MEEEAIADGKEREGEGQRVIRREREIGRANKGKERRVMERKI